MVSEPNGLLLREGDVPAGHALFVDRRGAVFAAAPELALTDPEKRDRASFPTFSLPALSGEGKIALDDYADRVVVLNFWASWCPPCRHELPVLDALARELDPTSAVVIGLNDDQLPRRGEEFLAELGGVFFPNVEGGGALRRTFGYRGLPYTVILDRNHRVVRSFYGFGGSLDAVRALVRDELTNNPGGEES